MLVVFKPFADAKDSKRTQTFAYSPVPNEDENITPKTDKTYQVENKSFSIKDEILPNQDASDSASENASSKKLKKVDEGLSKKNLPRDNETDFKKDKKRKLRLKLCKKYNAKYIAYYGEVFKVEKCKRVPVASDRITKLTGKGIKVYPVQGEVVNSIPVVEKNQHAKKSIRNCRVFNNSYITIDNDTIYLVKNCRKMRFPDWASFNTHRFKRGIKAISIKKVSWEELQSLKDGSDFESVLDSEDLLSLGEKVDTIPINEACKGLEGRFVYYYSRVYKIYKCHKRPVDPQEFSRKVKLKPKELSSEQWLSLPVGKPLRL